MSTDPLACPTCDGRVTDPDHKAGPGYRPCPATLKPLVDAYHAGESMQALADRLGVSFGIIRRRLIWGGANIRSEYPRVGLR